MELYISIVAIVFTLTGIWLGNHFVFRKEKGEQFVNLDQHEEQSPVYNEKALQELSISKREMEVLALMAKGCSNEEIAEKLFVSLNTIKKHSSSIFFKLDVKRRTQAVDKARNMGLLA